MKPSLYNVQFDMDNNKKIIYNTLSRKYTVYTKDKQIYLDNLFSNLNNNEYTVEELEIIKKLYKNKIIIDNNFDELELIKFKENIGTFQEQTFYLTIQPTVDCNFRCTYCYEEHRNIKMNDATFNGIINLVKSVSKRVRNISIGWFGGEPLLELNTIVKLTEKIKEICKENNCKYIASMVTNGYLLNDDTINKLKNLNIKGIQITLDGPEKFHNLQRPHLNGEGTFNIIKHNILRLLELDEEIVLTLRINVSKDNYNYINDLFDMIDPKYRSKVTLNMSNLFQEDNKLDLYNSYINAIEKGYKFYNTSSENLKKCAANNKNAIFIEPTGKLAICSPVAEKGIYYGHLNQNGTILYSNMTDYLKFHNLSVFESDNCIKCKQLPLCGGGCKYSKFENIETCNGCVPDGLSLSEKIKLHYYSDLKHNIISEDNIL